MSATPVNKRLMEDAWLDACLLSLASNVNAAEHLPACRHALASLGDLVVSPILINDCHQKADGVIIPAYHNQVARLRLAAPKQYGEVLGLTKQLEQLSGRAQYAKPLVTLDVDILAVKVVSSEVVHPLFDSRDWLALRDIDAMSEYWWAASRRLPLADYDRYGICHLPMAEQAPFASLLTLT